MEQPQINFQFVELTADPTAFQLYLMAKGTALLEKGYDSVFKNLSKEKQPELSERKNAFAKAWG